MQDYYLDGEERFGPIMSRLYSLFRYTGRAKELYNFIAGDLEKSKARRIIDIGTGTGVIPIMLAQRNHGLELYGVDPSKSMLKIARKAKGTLENVKLELGSSRTIPFKGSFEIIFTSLSFHHWKDKEDSLRYLATRLAKGGEIRIYEFNRRKANPLFRAINSHMSSISEIKESAEKAGLKLTSSIENRRHLRASLKQAAKSGKST